MVSPLSVVPPKVATNSETLTRDTMSEVNDFLRKLLAPAIRVVSLSPGVVETEFIRG